jgi:hypothetical protein
LKTFFIKIVLNAKVILYYNITIECSKKLEVGNFYLFVEKEVYCEKCNVTALQKKLLKDKVFILNFILE